MSHVYEQKQEATLIERLFSFFLIGRDQRLDPWEAYKPRVFVSSVFGLLFLISAFNLTFWLAGNSLGTFHSISVFASLLALITIYLFYRMGGSLNIATQSFMHVNAAILLSFTVMSGGFESPIITLLVLFPFLGIMLGAKYSAIYWTSFSIVAYLGFYATDLNQYVFPYIIDEQYLNITQMLGWFTLVTTLVVGLVVYGKANEHIAKQLYRRTKHLEEKVETHSATGFLNRAGLDAQFTLLAEKHSNEHIGLVLMKIYNFNDIRTSLDRNQAKSFYFELAKKCRRAVQKRVLIAQVSDEEFVFLLPEIRSSSELAHISREIFRLFKRGIQLDKIRISIDIFCGACMSNDWDQEMLMANAESALSQCSQVEPYFYNSSVKAA